MKFMIFPCLLWATLSFAAIPRTSMILQRTAENAGGGYYQIDQEVQFPNGQDTLVLKETWMIENENNMKLIVTGAKELKDQVSFTIQVNNGNHTQGSSTKRASDDFIEKYFHIRSASSFAQTLSQMKLIPANALARRPVRNLKDLDHQSESFVRLGRTGGVVAYAFGGLASQNSEPPGFWIEQDQFVLRKFRLPSQVEVVADRFSSYSRGLMFPRVRTIRWGVNQVTIQTISVTSRTKDNYIQFGSRVPSKIEALRNHQAAPLIEEFYSRFR
jgi:hypothetical protein